MEKNRSKSCEPPNESEFCWNWVMEKKRSKSCEPINESEFCCNDQDFLNGESTDEGPGDNFDVLCCVRGPD